MTSSFGLTLKPGDDPDLKNVVIVNLLADWFNIFCNINKLLFWRINEKVEQQIYIKSIWSWGMKKSTKVLTEGHFHQNEKI